MYDHTITQIECRVWHKMAWRGIVARCGTQFCSEREILESCAGAECAEEWPAGHKLAKLAQLNSSARYSGEFSSMVCEHFGALAVACVGILHRGAAPRTYLAAIPEDMRKVINSHIEVAMCWTVEPSTLFIIRVLDRDAATYPSVLVRDNHIITICYSGLGTGHIVNLKECEYCTDTPCLKHAEDAARAQYVIGRCI